jgi:hypothetical protein
MKLIKNLFCAVAIFFLSGCTQTPDASPYLWLAEKYDVVIERDNYGVPHIKGTIDINFSRRFNGEHGHTCGD